VTAPTRGTAYQACFEEEQLADLGDVAAQHAPGEMDALAQVDLVWLDAQRARPDGARRC
jgi:hypothetical protein